MSDLVSVIVPVYKTVEYLADCIHSIVNQSYKNLEIILVDDGSPDDSGRLCDDLSSADERIKVIHKKNGGLSDARNAGLAIAAGSYVLFCDSDDWMDGEIILNAVNAMNKTESQMVIWGYSADFLDSNGYVQRNSISKTKLTLETSRQNDFTNREVQGLLGYAWNKLYRLSLIKENQIEFDKGISLVEDVLFNAKVIPRCTKISFIDEIGTHYVQRSSTTLGTAFYPDYAVLINKAINAKYIILKHFGCPNQAIKTIISNYAMKAIKVGLLGIIRNESLSKKEKKDRIRMISSNNEMAELVRLARANNAKDMLLLLGLKHKVYFLLVII